MASVLDSFPYPWSDSVAQQLHIMLTQLHPTSQSALFVAQKAALDRTKINFNQTPVDIWKEILDAAAQDGLTGKLVQTVRDQLNQNSAARPFLEELLSNRSKKESLREVASVRKYQSLINLCNRGLQTSKLKKALNDQQAMMKQEEKLIPLICFVHGSPEENLDSYRDRLADNDLYELLKINAESGPKIEKYKIQWASHPYQLADLRTYFLEELSEQLFGHSNADEKRIFKEIGKRRAPLMISFRMETANWKSFKEGNKILEPSELMRRFLQFWNDMPEIKSGKRVIICLFFSYKPPIEGLENSYAQMNQDAEDFFTHPDEGEKNKPPAVRSGFNLPLNWFYHGNDGAIQLKNDNFPNLCGVILDKLPSVPLADVVDWIGKPKFLKGFCQFNKNIYIDMNELENDINELVRKPERTVINGFPALPMSRLTYYLSEILDKYFNQV